MCLNKKHELWFPSNEGTESIRSKDLESPCLDKFNKVSARSNSDSSKEEVKKYFIDLNFTVVRVFVMIDKTRVSVSGSNAATT